MSLFMEFAQFDLIISSMLVNPRVYQHPGKSWHTMACSKMCGSMVDLLTEE